MSEIELRESKTFDVKRAGQLRNSGIPYWIITDVRKADFCRANGLRGDKCEMAKNGYPISRIDTRRLDEVGIKIRSGKSIRVDIKGEVMSLFVSTPEGTLSNEILFDPNDAEIVISTAGGFANISYPVVKLKSGREIKEDSAGTAANAGANANTNVDKAGVVKTDAAAKADKAGSAKNTVNAENLDNRAQIEILNKYMNKEVDFDTFLKAFGKMEVYYSTPYGDHKDGTPRVFLLAGENTSQYRTGYHPVFISKEHIINFYSMAGRVNFAIMKGPFLSVLETTYKMNMDGAPVKIGSVIEPGLYNVALDADRLWSAIQTIK